MINRNLNLSNRIFEDDIELAATRQGFGEGLVVAGEKDDRVVALSADVAESTRAIEFEKRFPDRFIQVGVAEQLLATVAAGMANYGKIPFISSYAIFSPGRNWEQIRTTITLNNVPVKIIGSHAGLSVGPDGATHQMLEDIALMRAMPNIVVVSPVDSIEAKKATIEAAKNGKPTYIRLAREKSPVITTEDTPFKIGTASVFWEARNPEVTIIATGPLLYEALLAAKTLEQSGIETTLVNCHTIKPLDSQVILRSGRSSGAIVTVEEHQVNAGLGSAISELFSKNQPMPIEMVAVEDTFGESGKSSELLKKYGLTAENIIEKAKKVITRKRS